MSDLSFKTFCWAVIVGMGFALGSGPIRLVLAFLAKAAGAGSVDF